MEINLKEALLIYSERFDEGHPLRDIALTTLKELSRENPFGRVKEDNRMHSYQLYNSKTARYYDTLSDACYALGTRGSEARNDLRGVLRKYDLKLV